MKSDYSLVIICKCKNNRKICLVTTKVAKTMHNSINEHAKKKMMIGIEVGRANNYLEEGIQIFGVYLPTFLIGFL